MVTNYSRTNQSYMTFAVQHFAPIFRTENVKERFY